MAYENVKKQVVEYMRDLHSLPVSSPLRKKIKEQLGSYLKEVQKKYGQETVDKVMNNKPKEKKPTVLVICEKCGAKVSNKRLGKHIRKNH